MSEQEATSSELKKLYKEQLAKWKQKHGLTTEVLAERCGVSASYLGQIARYGRIPGRPVLILLAMNLDRYNPERWFRAAGIEMQWPYDRGIGLAEVENKDQGFLSVSFDMSRFEETIEKVILKTSRTRSVSELTQGRALRIGVDLGSIWAFQERPDGEVSIELGFLPKLLQTIAVSLQSRISLIPCSHAEYLERLESGDIDVFGPMFAQPGRLGNAMLTVPYASIGLSAVWRKESHPKLEQLEKPESLEGFKEHPYQIAVIRDGISQHYANARLGRTDGLLLCDSHEEREERLLLNGISRPAHMLLCDSITADSLVRQHPAQLEVLSIDDSHILDTYKHCLAVRKDWPELRQLIEDSVQFLLRGDSLQELFWKYIPRDKEGSVSFEGIN